MAFPICKRKECFANYLSYCTCLSKAYPEYKQCPFFKTVACEYKEIKDDTYYKLEGAFAPQVLDRIMKEGKKNG